MYIERTTPTNTERESRQSSPLPRPPQQSQRPETPSQQRCPNGTGTLPENCAHLAFPFVPMQGTNPQRYNNREALQRGTLFPGLDLPFHRELKTRFPAINQALSELMALDFAIDELGLYLTTHRDDQEALNLYWDYIRLGQEGRRKYEEMYGPLQQTTITEGSFRWLDDPWPWDEGGRK